MGYIDITPTLSKDKEVVNGRTYEVSGSSKNVNIYDYRLALYTSSVGLWSTANLPCPHWWQIDYGSPIILSEFCFSPRDDFVSVLVKDYELCCSNDGINYTTIGKGTCNGTLAANQNYPGYIVIPNRPVVCRYIKLVILSTWDNRGYTWSSIQNVKIMGSLEPEKCLYLSANGIHGIVDGEFIKIADDWTVLSDTEKKTLFMSTDYDKPAVADLLSLGKFRICKFSEFELDLKPQIKAVPKDQIIMPRGLMSIDSFEGIGKATLASKITGAGVCKLIVTNDHKAYRTYDSIAKEWKATDHTDLAAVKANGIDVAALQNIDHSAWDKLLKGKTGIGFAYLLGIDAIADQCEIDQLSLQADMKGIWK